MCSRRAGKSFGIAGDLLDAAERYPGSTPVYILMSRADAKQILWPALRVYDQTFDLGLTFQENTGDVKLPNTSRIIVRGAGSRREIDKMRGPAFPRANVDEAQGFGADLNYLIDEVLGPAVAQFEDGSIAITGTPNAACAGPFHEAVEHNPGGAWSVHRWTWEENPHVRDGMDEWLRNLMRRQNLSISSPKIRREYFGEWHRDTSSLVYAFEPSRNLIASFDPNMAPDFSYVLGIDLGFNDPTAFVVLAYSPMMGRAFVVESYKKGGLTPSSAAVCVERFMRQYDLETIVADTGGLGKGYEQEWVQRFGIPVQPAQKHGKMGYIQMLNGDFRTTALTVCADRNPELIEEISLLQWDSDKINENRWEQDRRYADHLADAMLYGWRECFHHNTETLHDLPTVGTSRFWSKTEEDMFERSLNPEGSDRPWWARYMS